MTADSSMTFNRLSAALADHYRVERVLGAAGEFLAALQQSAGLSMLVPTERHDAVLAEVLAEVPMIAGNLCHDAETAVLMREDGIRRI